MTSVRDFPKIKAIRSFIIGGVGSGMPCCNPIIGKREFGTAIDRFQNRW
jgi:hypothetical protein